MSEGQADPREALRRLAAAPLPVVADLRARARETAAQIRLGRSAFLEAHGVDSEFDYKRQAMRDGQIMYHAHIGLNDVDATTAALAAIHRALAASGHRLDRAGFALDRRMGLPPGRRAAVAAETGPMLERASDWRALAQTAPIQPHLGDFMIGQPASVANAVAALEIGCTTVGNLSQYFSFAAPGWDDIAETAGQTCEAMLMLAELRERGVMLHSYLEDGFGALFRHCATVAAWAMLEHYLVEALLGGRLAHCIGGLTRDPIRRVGWVIALDRIHQGDHVGSMIYGDTLSFGHEFERNRALTAEYLSWDILAQLHTPSGHAVLPLPVTEALRIPSADEIIEAQLFGRRVEASARRLYPHVDFGAAEAFADAVCRDGQVIFERALAGLADAGVDTRNPLRLLYVLKQLGAARFESLFAADLELDAALVTDMCALSRDLVDEHRDLFASDEMRARVAGRRFVVASTDVHEHAAGALAQLLGEAGAGVVWLGAEQSPGDLVAALLRESADALLVSTHNGMALEYARQLRERLDRANLSLPVVIGGVLNQKTADAELPAPVLDELRALGMRPAVSLPGLGKLLEFKP